MEGVELCFPQLNTSCRKPKPSHSDTVLIYIVLSSISLLNVTLNLLVIISISHFKKLHSPTNILLLSLAVSDFFVGLLMFFQIMLIDGCWFLGDLMCVLYYVLDYMITSASVGTMIHSLAVVLIKFFSNLLEIVTDYVTCVSPGQLHTPTNLLLLSLAVSNLLMGLLLMPVEIIYIESCWFLGDILCTLYYVVDYIITSVLVANMVLISADRYIAICDPLHYPTRVTKRRAQISLCMCWVCSVFYRFLLLHDHLKQPGRSNSCSGECVVVVNHIAGVVDLICTFIIPITVIILLYLRVFVVAVSQARLMRSHVVAVMSQCPGTATVKKMEIKAARTLGIVVLVFLFCFCPYYYPTLLGKDTSVNASAADFAIWLAHFNSCLNPVIYAFFYPWFRKSVKHILTLKILRPGSRDTKCPPPGLGVAAMTGTRDLASTVSNHRVNRGGREHGPLPLKGVPVPRALMDTLILEHGVRYGQTHKQQQETYPPTRRRREATLLFTGVNSNTWRLSWGAISKPTPALPLTLGNSRVVEGPVPLKELCSRAQAVHGGKPDCL
ncbi:hypothetical protein L3Q82_004253 [Scortum barcoo]|uniref:Uncharacterized protein n=1 Tax=Scortum barcoo TaxID=214431 RepID=A0ACB8VJL4_9TELE|nr:hypothetical protein L3Q82_004253 [Scortum barcoo]